jgi:hypothetical protein
MEKRTDTSGAFDPEPLTRGQGNALTAAWTRVVAAGRDGLRDTIAGLVAAVVLIANIVSFGALMFPGNLSAGMPIAIWAMLIGSSIGGVWIALRTSLPPIATGIDSPTGAVLVLLGASAGSDILAAGGSPVIAVQTVMLIFTAATVMSGALLYGLGICRWGSYFRFVPYFVIGGFLAATGWFLIAGGVRMTTGRTLVDLVAAGNLAIEITNSEGQSLGVRRITTHTIVGEMGFFRHSARAATVSSDGPATLFTLTRANFERMRRERPDLASAFDDFILRILADRIDFANHALEALDR